METTIDDDGLKAEVKKLARQHGFPLVGIAGVERFDAAERSILERIAAGMFAGLAWFTPDRARFSCGPRNHLPDARSLIALGISYKTLERDAGTRSRNPESGIRNPGDGKTDLDGPREESAADGHGGGVWSDALVDRPGKGGAAKEGGAPGFRDSPPGQNSAALRGRVARYAWGRDYHEELGARLKAFCTDLGQLCPPGLQLKTFVDTGRMVDRAVAQRAGLGWYGKNSNLLTHRLGSWVFLAEVLTNLPLPPDQPVKTHCGTCRACMPACPTGAIVAPGVVHSDRCISHLTIELRGAIPRELRPLVGDWVYGCDLCQDVCPVNRKAEASAPTAFYPSQGIGAQPDLLPLLSLSDQEFRQRFRHTPILRARRGGLLRNVCVALGNLGDSRAIPALGQALDDDEAIVRGHAAWALGRIGGPEARALLGRRQAVEVDAWVREEILLALAP